MLQQLHLSVGWTPHWFIQIEQQFAVAPELVRVLELMQAMQPELHVTLQLRMPKLGQAQAAAAEAVLTLHWPQV